MFTLVNVQGSTEHLLEPWMNNAAFVLPSDLSAKIIDDKS